ncbi:MAG TPA: ABC transporter permease subunit [Rhizomicrobium sp.]
MRFIVGQFALVVVLGLAVFALKYFLGYPDYLIPAPSDVWLLVQEQWCTLVTQTIITFMLTVGGLLLAVTSALGVALLAGRNKIVADFLLAIGTAWQTYPIVAIVPLLYILLSDSLAARLIIVWSMAVFPCFLVFLAIGSSRVEALESFFEQLGQWPSGGRLRIRLNYSAKPIENAIIGSGALALVGAVVAEFLLGNHGLGGLIRTAQAHNDTGLILASLAMIAVANCFYFPILRQIVRWALPGARDLQG